MFLFNITLSPFAVPTPPAAVAVLPRGSKPGGKRDRFLVSAPKTVATNSSTRGPSKTTTPTTLQESKGEKMLLEQFTPRSALIDGASASYLCRSG